jgi:ribosomal protein S18 acetylase RimI-like enzyme
MQSMADTNNKPLNVEIRPATIDDLADIFHLGEKLFLPREVSNLYRTWDEYEVTGLFNSEPEHMLVAECEGRLVGFAMGTVIEKNATAWTYGHLVWLGVDTDYSRHGIAGELFDAFSELMRKSRVRILLIDTQKDNHAAIRFFKKKGFTNPIAHVYMSLNLDLEES